MALDEVFITVVDEITVAAVDKYASEDFGDNAAFRISRGEGNVAGSTTVYFELLTVVGFGIGRPACTRRRLRSGFSLGRVRNWRKPDLLQSALVRDQVRRTGPLDRRCDLTQWLVGRGCDRQPD